MNYYIHPTSNVGKRAIIGENTRIWQFCSVLDDVYIGKNCNLGQNVYIETGVVIGDCVTIKNNVDLYKGVICEDKVFLGSNCVFTNVKTPRSFISRKEEIENTIVKKGATIGANATILCGCEIGEYAMVGAGSVVTKSIKAHNLVIGNPVKRVGYVCRCGVKLKCFLENHISCVIYLI